LAEIDPATLDPDNLPDPADCVLPGKLCQDAFSFLPDAIRPTVCDAIASVSRDTLERTAKGVIGAWARAQSADIVEQLNNGIRYFDLRLCVDTLEMSKPSDELTLADVKFTHTLVTQIDVVSFFLQVRNWLRVDAKRGGEVLIFKFRLFNLTSGPGWMYVRPDVQFSLQLKLLTFLQTEFGSMLSPANIPLDAPYSKFVGQNVVMIFENDTVQFPFFLDRPGVPKPICTAGQSAWANGTCNDACTFPTITACNAAQDKIGFVDFWSAYPDPRGAPMFNWLRNRDSSMSSFYAGLTDDPNVTFSRLYENYPKLGGPGMLTVLQGQGGFEVSNAVPVILKGLFYPSDLSGPDGLEQLAMRFTPNFVTNILPDPYGHTQGGWPRIKQPYSGYNIIQGDHVQQYNFSTLIVAANRGELWKYGGKAVPTFNDDQCHCALEVGTNVLNCGVCYTDPAGYDDTTCVGDGLSCYSTTALQCKYTGDCHWRPGMCTSDTGGALLCSNDGTQCTCKNKANMRSCRADKECSLGVGTTDMCVSNTNGVYDDNCRFTGAGCTCDTPDPLAPQCMSDADCTWNPIRSSSADPNKGSHNCYILGTESWCATPQVQCEDNSQCHLADAYCRSDRPGGYRCEKGSFGEMAGGDACVCTRPLPSDVAAYDPKNPKNYVV
jgi:hypothetical protein